MYSAGQSSTLYSPKCLEGTSLLKKSASSRWRPRIGCESPKTGASGVRSGVDAGIKGVFQQAGTFSEVRRAPVQHTLPPLVLPLGRAAGLEVKNGTVRSSRIS